MSSAVCVAPQGEVGGPGQKGSKGDKGELVSCFIYILLFMILGEFSLVFLCVFSSQSSI